jgi:signal transduction histidine kinase
MAVNEKLDREGSIVDFDNAFSQVGGSPHSHACIIFDDLASYRKIACKYILEGLDKNEKCIMAVDDYTSSMIYDDFAAAHENIDHYLEDGRLVIFKVQESYAGNGGFDPDQTVKIWQNASNKAVDEGFDALRVVGEATFSLHGPELAEKLIYYENIINQILFPDYPFKSLCVYNKRLYPPEVIKTAISAHPILFYNDELYLENIHYVPPHIHFKKNSARDEIDVWLANVKRNNKNIQFLRESENKFRAIFNSAPNMLMLVNEDYRIEKINKRTVASVKKQTPDLCGLLFGDVLQCIHSLEGGGCKKTAECDRCPVKTRIDSTFRTGQPHKDEEGRMTFAADGKTVPHVFLISTTRIEFDDTTRVLLSMTDITSHRRLEECLLQAQKMESIGNLAGGIAHDFNNLLFPIIGASELLLEDLPHDSLEHENVQQILQAGIRGRDLVKQILSFCRQDQYQQIPVRVQKVIKEVLKLVRSTIPAGITISHCIQPDCGPVMADPSQLHQIAMNLITNAFHAVENKNNGKIDIKVKEILLDELNLISKSQKPGRYVLFSVSDNGAGIPRNHLEKIFEPYFTTKEKGKGTGLGLAVVYGIVKKHNGDIKVYSDVNQGTTINIFVPVLKTENASDPLSKHPDISHEPVDKAEMAMVARNVLDDAVH